MRFIAIIIVCTTFAQAEETVRQRLNIPTPLVIPADLKNDTSATVEPIPELRLIVDPVPVGSAAGCPMDASVIVAARSGQSTFRGSGTCVVSSGGKSTVLTCWHIFRGLKDPEITITHEKKEHRATLLKSDERNDLAVLEIDADLPAVGLSPTKPTVHDQVTSVGLRENDNANLVEISHKITAVDKYDNPRNFESDGTQSFGRSGGGLFFNGQLCGIIQGRRNDVARSIYVSIEPIREILGSAVGVGGTVGAGQAVQREATIIMSPNYCPPCNQLKRRLGNGNDRVKVSAVKAERGWNPTNGNGFPYVRYIDSSGKEHIWKDIVSLEQLEKSIDIVEGELQPNNAVSSGPVGATIQGRAVLEAIIAQMVAIAGDGATASFRWHREGGLDALPVTGTHTRKDVFGDKGRIEFSVKSAKRLMVKSVAFDYRFANGKFFFRPDEIECEIPEDGCVGAAQPVGSPVLIAWTIISIGWDLYTICHPTADIFLGKDLGATATLKDSKLAVVFTGAAPKLRLHWSFMLGLLRVEYSRALTGIVVGVPVVLQFHESRIYRDVTVDVQ